MDIKSMYLVERVTDNAVFIVDEYYRYVDSPRHPLLKSVTNDAENVVKAISKVYGNKRIFYKDTQGRWSELAHENGEFSGFRAGSQLLVE